MAWPDIPILPQPDDTSDIFRQRLADFFNYVSVVFPLIGEIEAVIGQFDTILAAMNFVGRWADQTGPATVPCSVHHADAIYILLEDVADITADEPGQTANWFTIPAPVKTITRRALTSTITSFAVPLDAATRNRYDLMLESFQHDQAADRALMVAFSTDDPSGPLVYGAPIQVSEFADNATDLDVDLSFFLSATTARSLHSSALGNLGRVVPAGATAMRIGVGTAGEFNGKVTKGAVDGTLDLTGYKGA